MANIFDETYTLIEDFVSREQNARLKAGTGRYSTLFRGTLFGTTDSATVYALLKTKAVDVLWLGSNPNVPESLQQILNVGGSGDYGDFLTQKNSGHFSSVIIDKKSGVINPDWDPINKPNHQWSFYTEIFDELYGQGSTLMANFIPWGSKSYPFFVKEMSALDSDLLGRILTFCTMLNRRLIASIKPKLVVIPKSICQLGLDPDHLCGGNQQTIQHRIDAKVPFIFTVKEAMTGNHEFKILKTPHPCYTSRAGKEHRAKIQQQIIDVLR